MKVTVENWNRGAFAAIFACFAYVSYYFGKAQWHRGGWGYVAAPALWWLAWTFVRWSFGVLYPQRDRWKSQENVIEYEALLAKGRKTILDHAIGHLHEMADGYEAKAVDRACLDLRCLEFIGYVKSAHSAEEMNADSSLDIGRELDRIFPTPSDIPADNPSEKPEESFPAVDSDAALRILVVDDEPAILEHLTAILCKRGHEVIPKRVSSVEHERFESRETRGRMRDCF